MGIDLEKIQRGWRVAQTALYARHKVRQGRALYGYITYQCSSAVTARDTAQRLILDGPDATDFDWVTQMAKSYVKSQAERAVIKNVRKVTRG